MLIRRRPSAATFVAALATLALGSQIGLAAPAAGDPPQPVRVVEVTATDRISVTIAWPPSRDRVAGYGIYVNGTRIGTETQERLRWRDRQSLTYTISGLTCGTGYTVGVDAYDRDDNRSPITSTTVSTSACPDTMAPTEPTGARQVAATETSVVLAWTPSTDNVGVVEYGLYASGLRVATVSEAAATLTNLTCGTSYLIGIDAADAAGNRSTRASSFFRTAACSPPPPTGAGSVRQTIANGATLSGVVNWRAVYDRNGDNVEDDPGSIEFLVDNTLVLTEEHMPFGDWTDHWTSTAVPNGQHTFRVRAKDSAGVVLATSTVTATVANNAPPPGDTTPPSTPTNVRVVSATGTSVTIAWNASTDNVGVTGYGLYRGTAQTGQTQQTTATYSGLSCGTVHQVGVDASDAAGNRSSRANLAVTTAPCPDTQPPTAPANVTASTRTTTSVTLTWASSTDNVGVAGYRVYNGATLVHTTTGTAGIVGDLLCNRSYTLSVDAYDASGNSSAKTAVMVSTLPCPDTTPPTVTLTSPTNGSAVSGTITVSANASDNVGVTRVEFLRDGVSFGNDTTSPYSVTFDTTTITNGSHTFVGRAYDAAGNVGNATTVNVTVSNTSTPPGNASCPLPAHPDASCTGVPPGTTLTPSGGLTITTAGAVIEGRDITGAVIVNAPNVTIRNSRIRSNAFRAVESNSTGLVIEDSEIVNHPVAGQNNCHNAIGFGNFTVRRTEISGCENGADMGGGNVTFTDNYVHDLDTTGPSHVWGNDPHTDGIQVGPSGNNLVIRHNTIDPIGSVVGSGGTAGIILSTDSPNNNVRIEDNYVDGRNSAYAIYAPRQQTSAVYINRNRLHRGAFGYTACVRLGITVIEFNDNRDAGTGVALAPDNGAGGSCTN